MSAVDFAGRLKDGGLEVLTGRSWSAGAVDGRRFGRTDGQVVERRGG